MKKTCSVLMLILLIGLFMSSVFTQTDPLPSWNDGASKKAIVDFVTKVTAQSGADFIKPEDRIATFDNTLQGEKRTKHSKK